MAPRQLLLELEEVDTAAAKGPKRVRADSTNEGSTQMVSASIDPFEPTAAELAGDDPAVCEMDTTPQGQETQFSNDRAPALDDKAISDQKQHYTLAFTQVTEGKPFARIDPKKANFEVYANAAQAGLEPINPMCISAPPTGPILYACTEQYTKDYIMLYPGGIDVEATKEGEPKVHFKVSSRPSNKPNPAKRRVAANILNRIAITVQHYELRGLAQFLKPTDIAAGWAALGFDPINPRWGQNKMTNPDGETALGGRNSVIWIDLTYPTRRSGHLWGPLPNSHQGALQHWRPHPYLWVFHLWHESPPRHS